MVSLPEGTSSIPGQGTKILQAASVVKKKEITLESPLNWPGKGQDGNLLGSDILTHPEGLRNFQPRLKVATMQETQETCVQSLGWEDPLEKEMATHSSILS